MKLLAKSAVLGAVAALAVGTSPVQAQVGLTSSLATVNINATKSSVLSLLINSGGTQNLASLTDNTTNNFASPVNVTTTWDLNANSNVVLVGSFGTPAQALASGTNYITSSLVKGRVTTGTLTSFTADNPATAAYEASVAITVVGANRHARNSGELQDMDASTPGTQVKGGAFTVSASTDPLYRRARGLRGGRGARGR